MAPQWNTHTHAVIQALLFLHGQNACVANPNPNPVRGGKLELQETAVFLVIAVITVLLYYQWHLFFWCGFSAATA